MSDKRTFSVATIGIPENERKVLRNIFRLSQYRPRSYVLGEANGSGHKEILIVDPQGDNAPDEWQRFRETYPNTPTVVLTTDHATGSQTYYTRRPLVATRVLGVLDQIAINEFSFAPEIVIGAKETESAPSKALLVDKAVRRDRERKSFRYTALVVDDSQAVRKQIELELRLFDVAADYAESGEQAFEFLDHKSYDVVFLDVMLPGVDGYRICRSIKKDKAKKHMPVIMLTGKSSPFDRIKGAFAGCDTYLTKPVAHDSFRKVIRKYLN